MPFNLPVSHLGSAKICGWREKHKENSASGDQQGLGLSKTRKLFLFSLSLAMMAERRVDGGRPNQPTQERPSAAIR